MAEENAKEITAVRDCAAGAQRLGSRDPPHAAVDLCRRDL